MRYRINERSKQLVTNVGTTVEVEYGTTLVDWNNSIDDGAADGVITDAPVDVPGEDYSTVTVKIPKALAAGGKLFARLNVAIAQ